MVKKEKEEKDRVPSTEPRPADLPSGPLSKAVYARMVLNNKPLSSEAHEYLLQYGVFEDKDTHRAVATTNAPWSLIYKGQKLDLTEVSAQNILDSLGIKYDAPYSETDITLLREYGIHVVVPKSDAPPVYTEQDLIDMDSAIVEHMNEPITNLKTYGWIFDQYRVQRSKARKRATKAKTRGESRIKAVLKMFDDEGWGPPDWENFLVKWIKHSRRFGHQRKYRECGLTDKDETATVPFNPESGAVSASYRWSARFCKGWAHLYELLDQALGKTSEKIDVEKDIYGAARKLTIYEFGVKHLIEKLGVAFCVGRVEDIGDILRSVGVREEFLRHPYIVDPGSDLAGDALFYVGSEVKEETEPGDTEDMRGPAQKLVSFLKQINLTSEVVVYELENRIDTIADELGERLENTPLGDIIRGLHQGVFPEKIIDTHVIKPIIDWPVYKKQDDGSWVISTYVKVIHPEIFFRQVWLAIQTDIWEETHPASWAWGLIHKLQDEEVQGGTKIIATSIFNLLLGLVALLMVGTACLGLPYIGMIAGAFLDKDGGSAYSSSLTAQTGCCGLTIGTILFPVAFYFLYRASQGKV